MQLARPSSFCYSQAQQAPELLRVPLESVVMTVKAIFGATAPAQAVLGRAVTPPDAGACRAAVDALKVPVDCSDTSCCRLMLRLP